jgi:hypothetical protein
MICSIASDARPNSDPTEPPVNMLLRAAALAAVLTAAVARADDSSGAPPGPDHGKMATEDATPVGEGVLEVEAGWAPSLTAHGSGPFEESAHAHSHGYSFTAAYGVSEHLDVKVGLGAGYLVDLSDPAGPTRGSGLSDLLLAARWRFLASDARALDLAVTTALVAPTGDDGSDDSLGLSQGYWSLRNALVASKDWGRATANAAIALTLPVGGDAGALDLAGCASVAFGYAVVPWLQPIAEASYDAVRDGDTQHRLSLTAGVNLSSSSGNRLLVGVQQAVWGRDVVQSTTALVALKTAF